MKISRRALDLIVKRFQDKDYDVYAKPPDSRDKILTNEIPHTESCTVTGERMTLKPLNTSNSRKILRDLNTHTVTAPNVDARGIFTSGSTYLY